MTDKRIQMEFTHDFQRALQQAQRALANYNEKAFPKRPPEFFALELSGEAGELANKEKKIWKGKTVSPDSLAQEAADVLIAVMNYCNSRNIDLGTAFLEKIEIIESRRLAEQLET
ncbi:MAG: MazG nucleotide pyrophosphohydrolase domain-containing protein [Sumerlaeia bacterium]